METTKTLMERLFTSNDTNLIVAVIIFTLLGVLFSILVHYLDKKEKDDKFSVGYMISHNWTRILIGVIAAYAVLRFSNELIGMPFNELTGFTVGVSIDQIIKIIRGLKLKKNIA